MGLQTVALLLSAACNAAAPAPTRVAKAAPKPAVVQPALAVASSPAPVAASTQPASATHALTRVSDSSNTCMLSNRYFGARKQVPVEVAGKTYHGCCPRCAARLGADASARVAIDPVTGHEVDKASAVLAHDDRNALYYFESEATLARFAAR